MLTFIYRTLSLHTPTPISQMARTRAAFSTSSSASSTPHILIAGLGNAPYPDTRHSVGQRIITSLSTHLHIPLTSKRHGHIGTNAAGTITLFKSKHLMNISGPSVADALRSLNLPDPTHLILVYDSLVHAPMTLSVRLGGSANGHNGVKSVMQKLGGTATTKMFWQFRAGIGRGEEISGVVLSGKKRKEVGKGVDAAEWVLGKMSKEELQFWGPQGKGVELVMREVERVVRRLSGEEELVQKLAVKKPKAPKPVVLDVPAEDPQVTDEAEEPEKVVMQASPSG